MGVEALVAPGPNGLVVSLVVRVVRIVVFANLVDVVVAVGRALLWWL